MSQLDHMSPNDREAMANWKSPDTAEAQTPEAIAAKILTGSKKNAEITTPKEGKPGWHPYEDRLAVAERGWIQQSMEKIKDPAVLEKLQQRMAEIDQMPGIMGMLNERAARENTLETFNASIEKSKTEAAKLLEELPKLEAQLQQLSPSDTVTLRTNMFTRGEPVEISSHNAAAAEAINQFLEKCKAVTVPGNAFAHTVRGNELSQTGRAGAGDLYGMELMWTGKQIGNGNELRTNAAGLTRMLREGLEAAKELKNPLS